jgi:hypothetical protein
VPGSTPEDLPKHQKLLTDHRATAKSISWAFLCSGRSHECGDYTKEARVTQDRLFDAAKQEATRFLQEL